MEKKQIIKEITLRELTKIVNKVRKQKIGYEVSFAEMNETEPQGWHTCTKINKTEVIVRYMGGVCFGLITDTDVEVCDMVAYMENAGNYIGKCDEDTIVYLEIDTQKTLQDIYKKAVDFLNGDTAISQRDTIDETCDFLDSLELTTLEKNKQLFDLYQKCSYHINMWNEETLAEHILNGSLLIEEISGVFGEILNN